ncbi:hypothetical protein IFM89_030438 [Coptis chinensis]|uniref:Transposase-associated domain-containing protein n=1 Tax=Coptis chinensis TaxID=261450 RepID=A0A835HXK1_9MAGN|nr:hypothetical protein IFM89_030438 [Coptis chinensis]
MDDTKVNPYSGGGGNGISGSGIKEEDGQEAEESKWRWKRNERAVAIFWLLKRRFRGKVKEWFIKREGESVSKIVSNSLSTLYIYSRMSRPIQKEWMNELDRFGDVYKQGVADFIQFATVNNRDSTTCPCPCRECRNGKSFAFGTIFRHLIRYGMDKNYRVWVLHGENPYTDPVVEPVIEEENTEVGRLRMRNFVDASYGVHEVVAGDLNEDEENHMGDFEPPPVLEPNLGKRYNEYKKMAEQKLYPSFSHASQPLGDMQELENVKKLRVLIDIDGVIVGDNASRWNTRAGSLIRARTPVSYTDWRLVHLDFKDKVWNALMNKQNPDKIHGWVDSWKAGHERRNITILESARARYELVEAAQKKRKIATHLDFDNDELNEVLGADKRNKTQE